MIQLREKYEYYYSAVSLNSIYPETTITIGLNETYS
jgi:hypothetical protein